MPAPRDFLRELQPSDTAVRFKDIPDQQTGEKFAAFTYMHSDAQNPICGTVHNVVSPEMLYVSGSSGAQFDERARQLRETQDIVSAIETGATSQDK